MQPRDFQGKCETVARALLGVAAFLMIVVLAGCASNQVSRQRPPATEAESYVGVFTGAFVDGKPLYRFPAIEVIGSRSSIGPGY